MPRSSKHKSSKHGSREYSDSERDSGLKDHRKGKDEKASAKTSRDAGSGEKRKLDSKDGIVNGECLDEYSSWKRSKDRSRVGGGGDGGGRGERWTGGEDDRGEQSKKTVATGNSKSRRRDESVGMYGSEVEEVKKSGGKGDGKHDKDSSRKDSREGTAVEKERKVKEGRSERLVVDNEEQRMSKQSYENSDSRNVDELRNPELDNQTERQTRKKRDSGDGKHQDDGDDYDRRLSSRDEIAKDGRLKYEKRKDEKYRDKCREEMDKESKHRHDKQRDVHPAKDHTSIKSDDKHARGEKDSLESRQKRTKLLESDQDRDHNHDRAGDRDHYLESGRDCERHNECIRDHDYDLDRDHDFENDRDWDQGHDRHHDRDRRRDHDVTHVDDHNARSKDSRTKKRTSDDYDDYTDSKSRVIKGQYTDGEKRSLNSSRADSHVDRGRSQPRQAYADPTGTTNKDRSSSASNTRIRKDEYRNANSEDTVYRDSMMEQRTQGSREGYCGILEAGPNYKSMEKPIKIDGPIGDLSTERSSIVKATSMGLMERSSTSIEHRYMNKSGARLSLEIEESGRRKNISARDFSTSDDSRGRELTLEKSLLEEPSQAESSSYSRTSQGIASLIPPLPAFRAAPDRPFMGALEEDVRDNSSSRHRRNSDPGFGRGHVNSRRAVPNWTSRVPNGFVPFQPGPAHGGFQTMMPKFTSQPLFGVRPSMEVNCTGIPYHIADTDRFPGHLRPLGWQNVMGGRGPAHLHGWESNNGAFRDDPHMYGSSDWDQNRHSTNSRGWESGSEPWKEHNGDSKDMPSPACKDESVPAQVDDDLTNQATPMSQDDEHNQDEFHEKSPETKLSSLSSPVKVPLNSLSTTVLEKLTDSLTPSDNTSLFSRFYLSRLDISADLVIPELYDQYLCLVNVEKNASSTTGASAKLFRKNGSRAQKKYGATFLRRPFPATDNSIFQRAIDLYKKQRVELPNRGTADVFWASNQVQVDESIPIPSLEDRQVSASVSHGMEDVPKSTLEQNKMEALSPAKEHLEEINQSCSQKEQEQDCSHPLRPVMSSQSSGPEKQREPVAGLCEKEDQVTPDMVNSGDAEDNNPAAFKNKSQLAPTLHEDGDNMNSKAKPTDFTHRADEKLGFGDTMVSPLIFEDASPRACDALMPGSNESESLILSRIHHSSESTR